MKIKRSVISVLAVVLSSAFFTACGTDCRKTMRDAEFEFTQRNFARAEKLFEEAWRADSVACPDAKTRRADALKFLGR